MVLIKYLADRKKKQRAARIDKMVEEERLKMAIAQRSADIEAAERDL